MRNPTVIAALCLAGMLSGAGVAPAMGGAAGAEVQPAGDRLAPFLAGVTEVAAPGVPGTLAVWGERAQVIVVGKAGDTELAPVVAAGRYGSGRVVAFAHTGYAGKEALETADTKALMVNAVKWAGAGGSVLTNSAELATVLEGAGIKASATQEWAGALEGSARPGVVVITGSFGDGQVPALAKFVSSGGGLILCETGWGWKQGAKGAPMTKFAANKVLAPAGIAFTDETVERTGKAGFDVKARPATDLCHALEGLDQIGMTGEGPKLDRDRASQAEYTLFQTIQVLPLDDRQIRPRFAAMLEDRGAPIVPTEAAPVKNIRDRVILAFQVHDVWTKPVGEIRAFAAATDFPGTLPPNNRPGAKLLDLDIKSPGWYTTGYYATPGKPVHIGMANKYKDLGIRIRIGAHSDELWNKDEWKRVPEISHVYEVDAANRLIVSPFGGPIYVQASEALDPARMRVNIEGAMPMPEFVLGQTKKDEWVKIIRAVPVPWTELSTSKVILTVPSENTKTLDDPEAVLKVWDEIMDAQADLAAIPRERKRPERIVADRQISAGYMHSGYPIMTHLDAAPAMVSVEKLKAGQWGLFHELGHNHQNPDWTFDGTGEVTCNLFSLYTMEKVCGKAFGEGHDALKDWKQKAAKYVKDGAKFDEWKKDPFLALTMYMQLAEGFGWDTYKKVFAEYNALKKEERPKNDDEKRDQWMVRFSKACGKNLGPFFQAWGVPTSSAARDSVKDLPVWMPEGFGG